MKHTIYIILTVAALSAASIATATTRTDRLIKSARQSGLSEDQISELRTVCENYERAFTELSQLAELHGLTRKRTAATQAITADVRDPAIQQIAKVAKEQRNRYEVLSKIITKYDPHRTNMFARVARTSMQEKLNTARQEAVEYFTSYTNQICQTVAYSNAMVIAQGVATSAMAKISDEIADLEAKIVKYKEYQTKYPLLKSIFAAMITDAENRIKVLQTLQG